jgi:hypothetical protein
MERGGKDSEGYREVEGSLEPSLHRKVEEDGISEVKIPDVSKESLFLCSDSQF